MKAKSKITILLSLWLATTSGAFFYGYTRAVRKSIPELKVLQPSKIESAPSAQAAAALTESQAKDIGGMLQLLFAVGGVANVSRSYADPPGPR